MLMLMGLGGSRDPRRSGGLKILVRTERPKNNLNISRFFVQFFRCYVGENDERSIEDCAERDKQNPSTDPKEKTKSVSELKEWVCSKYNKPGMRVTSFLGISCLSNSEHWSQKTS